MTIQSNQESYYDLIEDSGYHVIVLGEIGEQWTDEVLDTLEREEVDVFFFPWRSSLELRLQIEVVYYPIIQLWLDGSLKVEVCGYHNESIKNLIQQIK